MGLENENKNKDMNFSEGNKEYFPPIVDNKIECDDNGFSQWAFDGNGSFFPIEKTIKKIPPGLYEIMEDSRKGPFLQQISLITEELFILPSPEIESIIDDIKKFWNGKDIFKKYNYVHKRGILLHGSPGGGKSGIIQLCSKYVINKMGGIVINIKDHIQVRHFDEFIQILRRIEPDRPLIVIMEDLDSLTGDIENRCIYYEKIGIDILL